MISDIAIFIIFCEHRKIIYTEILFEFILIFKFKNPKKILYTYIYLYIYAYICMYLMLLKGLLFNIMHYVLN